MCVCVKRLEVGAFVIKMCACVWNADVRIHPFICRLNWAKQQQYKWDLWAGMFIAKGDICFHFQHISVFGCSDLVCVCAYCVDSVLYLGSVPHSSISSRLSVNCVYILFVFRPISNWSNEKTTTFCSLTNVERRNKNEYFQQWSSAYLLIPFVFFFVSAPFLLSLISSSVVFRIYFFIIPFVFFFFIVIKHFGHLLRMKCFAFNECNVLA